MCKGVDIKSDAEEKCCCYTSLYSVVFFRFVLYALLLPALAHGIDVLSAIRLLGISRPPAMLLFVILFCCFCRRSCKDAAYRRCLRLAFGMFSTSNVPETMRCSLNLAVLCSATRTPFAVAVR